MCCQEFDNYLSLFAQQLVRSRKKTNKFSNSTFTLWLERCRPLYSKYISHLGLPPLKTRHGEVDIKLSPSHPHCQCYSISQGCKMTREFPIIVKKENGTKPSVIMATENNIADMKCVLLERALTIKEGKIQNLEKRINSLEIQLENAERKLVLKQERETGSNNIKIINTNKNTSNISNMYCYTATVVLMLGIIKIIIKT